MIAMKIKLLIRHKHFKNETKEIEVEYASPTALAYDLVRVANLHGPGTVASVRTRRESVPFSAILTSIKDWSPKMEIIVLSAKENVGENIPEHLLRDPEMLHFMANQRLWMDQNKEANN